MQEKTFAELIAKLDIKSRYQLSALATRAKLSEEEFLRQMLKETAAKLADVPQDVARRQAREDMARYAAEDDADRENGRALATAILGPLDELLPKALPARASRTVERCPFRRESDSQADGRADEARAG